MSAITPDPTLTNFNGHTADFVEIYNPDPLPIAVGGFYLSDKPIGQPDKSLIPALSSQQQEAMNVLEETCQRMALHMILDVGDIQFLSNAHVLHARTAYTDHPPPAPRRHLMRLWLSTPETEGGWALPMPDSRERKRGGIQVDDTPPRAPLDAE